MSYFVEKYFKLDNENGNKVGLHLENSYFQCKINGEVITKNHDAEQEYFSQVTEYQACNFFKLFLFLYFICDTSP